MKRFKKLRGLFSLSMAGLLVFAFGVLSITSSAVASDYESTFALSDVPGLTSGARAIAAGPFGGQSGDGTIEHIPATATAKDFYDYENRWGQQRLLLGRPEQMINGVINQEWQTDAWIGNAHQDLWVMFSFEQTVELNKIIAYASNDGVTKSYYIQSSTDGSSWSNLFAEKVTTASGETSTFTFEDIQTKYIRFEDIDTSPDNNPSFTEVRFFRSSDASESPAPTKVDLITEKSPFREAGPWVPEITTYIPTPLDISTEPAVVGTNLMLAALMMLPFAVAAEYFTGTLSEHEATLRRIFRPVAWIGGRQRRLGKLAGTRLGYRLALIDIIKLLGVMFFYGLVFSLLDPTWHPLSLKGVILFVSMIVAYGLVGIASDVLKWRAIRRWGLPADLSVRPTSIVLAVASTATTRLLSLVPGLMFGTPEALQADESSFDARQRNSLLKISAFTFAVMGLGVWMPTAVTAALQRQSLPEVLSRLLGGMEGFLLVVFAVTLENLFVEMVGLPSSLGQALKRRNRGLWLFVLVGVTFLFYHTLINPRGDLAQALQESNVILFLSAVGVFVVITFGMWLYFAWQFRRGAARLA